MVDGQAPEAALELVAIDDRARVVRRRRLIGRQETEVGRPAAGPAGLGVAGAHEEPVRPGVKARRVAELGKVPPDGQQRLLRRILGEVDVAQDPVRHRVEPVAGGDGEAREGLLVTVLRPDHEIGIHTLPPVARRSDPAHSHGMGADQEGTTQSSRCGRPGTGVAGRPDPRWPTGSGRSDPPSCSASAAMSRRQSCAA